MYSDGRVQEEEDITFKKMIEFENIPDDSLVQFNKDIRKKSLDELRQIGLENLKKGKRDDQIKTLAWVHKMIDADKKVHIKEAQFLMYAIKPTDISYSELQNKAKALPGI